MKDYEAYMNRQRLSESGMARLIKLEETGRKGIAKREVGGGKRAPQWVKYCAMAASLVVVLGVFALTMFRLGGANPFARQPVTPTADPVEPFLFNTVDDVPFPDEAIAGDMKLYPIEIADISLLFGSSEDDFGGFQEDVGWDKFNMEYYGVDMVLNSAPLRFLLQGNYISAGNLPAEINAITSFTPVNTVWLEIFEGHSYLEEDGWKELTSFEVNGHRVIAAHDGSHDRAAAVFDVECNGKTYGVLYSVTAYGEEDARELVTKLVRRVTKDGLYPEIYGVDDGEPVELSGLYYMELGGEETVFCPRMVFYGDGGFQCVSDLASSHLCDGTFTVRNGQVVTNCDQHRFVFDILDENTLRYVGEQSDEMVRYLTPKVVGGAVFRRREVLYGEEIADRINALEAELNEDMHHAEPSHNVETTHHPEPSYYVEATHHPEPSDHVETNHHEEERHSTHH